MSHTKYVYRDQTPAVILECCKFGIIPTRYSELHKISVEIENFYALCTF